MRRLVCICAVLFVLFVLLIPYPALCGDVPSWAYQSARKDGDKWLFSGSVHDISLLNVAIPLARASALSNLASTIAVSVNSQVAHSVEGSEVDGYVQSILVNQRYSLNQVSAYGVLQREVFVERINDPSVGRVKFNVYVLLEVSESDLRRAQEDFAKRIVAPKKPIMKSKESGGILSRIARKVGL